MNFNTYFVALPTREKFILYTLPLFVFLLFWLNFPPSKVDKVIQFTNINSEVIDEKSHILILQSYEKLANDIGIKIEAFHFDKSRLSLELIGSEPLVILFLKIIEKTTKVLSLELEEKDNNLIAKTILEVRNKSLTVTFGDKDKVADIKLFQIIDAKKSDANLDEESQKVVIIDKPTIQVKQEKIEGEKKAVDIKSENINFDEAIDDSYVEVLPRSKTIAIVGEYVLVGGEWLKIGQSFDGYKIVAIEKDKLTLEKNGKVAIKEMFDD